MHNVNRLGIVKQETHADNVCAAYHATILFSIQTYIAKVNKTCFVVFATVSSELVWLFARISILDIFVTKTLVPVLPNCVVLFHNFCKLDNQP